MFVNHPQDRRGDPMKIQHMMIVELGHESIPARPPKASRTRETVRTGRNGITVKEKADRGQHQDAVTRMVKIVSSLKRCESNWRSLRSYRIAHQLQ
jgi:hypothetical protein